MSSKSVRKWWWWERVVLGFWMLVMLVVVQSYAGNLISFLTVRYIPLPIQSLQDVLDHPSITFLVPGGTSGAEAFFDAKGGIFREVGDLQYVGRIKTYLVSESVATLDTLVRRGDHVLNLLGTRTSIMIAQDFSAKGRCDFYHAREEILPMIAGFVGPKGSPLVPALSRRLMMAAESGLYYHWLQLYTPNYTSCLKAPTKVLIRTPLGIANTWGTLVVLGGGMIISLLVFFLEVLWSSFI